MGTRFWASCVVAGLLAAASTGPVWAECDHTITLWDEYGDGWSGCSVDVYVAGALVLGGLTLDAGSGPETTSFPAATGDEITTVWTSGSYPSECYYCIYDGAGTELGCDGMGGAEPEGMTVFGYCESPTMGTEFSYQGQLYKNGAPLNDVADLVFTLWDAPSEGAQVSDIISIDEYAVVDGLVLAELDFCCDLYKGDPRYLQVEVRSPAGGGDYTTLEPRQKLTATPYASCAKEVTVPLALVGDGSQPVVEVSSPDALAQLATAESGVYAEFPSAYAGARGFNHGYLSGSDYGVYGRNSNGNRGWLGLYRGIAGAEDDVGVRGKHNNGNRGCLGLKNLGVWGYHTPSENYGFLASADYGAYGRHEGHNNWAALGASTAGVYAAGYGDYLAGYFSGDVEVMGDLSANGPVRGASDSGITEYTSLGHGGENGYVNWVGDGRLDFRNSGTTLATIDQDGHVGIGTTDHLEYTMLHVHGEVGAIKITNSGTGTNYGDGTLLSFMSTGSKTAILWNRENAPLVFATNDTQRMRIASDGKVGIGVTDPSQKLDVSGSARLRSMSSGTGTAVVVDGNGVLKKLSSGRRYKRDIQPLEFQPQQACQLRPVKFTWRETGEPDIGLVAEEVAELLPELVVRDNNGRPDAVKYDRLALYLLEIVKAQEARIAALEAQLAPQRLEAAREVER